jgi:hypothetical protein
MVALTEQSVTEADQKNKITVQGRKHDPRFYNCGCYRRGDLGCEFRLLADSDFAGKGDDTAWISAVNAELECNNNYWR